jgi:hypothetical protein
VLGDVELVEHQHRLRCPFLDNIGVGLPHVAAHALEPRAALRAEEVEECPQGGSGGVQAQVDTQGKHRCIVQAVPQAALDEDIARGQNDRVGPCAST